MPCLVILHCVGQIIVSRAGVVSYWLLAAEVGSAQCGEWELGCVVTCNTCHPTPSLLLATLSRTLLVYVNL